MFAIIGIVVGFICIFVGYTMHGGQIGVLIQISEFIIIGGAGLGIFIASNGKDGVTATIKACIGVLKPDPYTKPAFVDLLKMLYQLFNVARKEGLLGLEKHIETPAESDIIKKFPAFLANHHACDFLCDTLKVILTGAVGPHDLSEMMELDLEIAHKEAHMPADAVQNVADAMPAVGIVAAVLGVIITMGKIGGEASAIGHSVAAALVGTFLGIFLAYCLFAPIAKAIEGKLFPESQYMNAIRFALFSFARGESPVTCVEFARRNIAPACRPSFSEVEKAVKEKDAA
jgi:chemotaxis protein MotA